MLTLDIFDQKKFLAGCNKSFFCIWVDDLTAIRTQRHDANTDRVVRRLLKVHIQLDGDSAATPDNAAFVQAILKAMLAIGWHNANPPTAHIFRESSLGPSPT